MKHIDHGPKPTAPGASAALRGLTVTTLLMTAALLTPGCRREKSPPAGATPPPAAPVVVMKAITTDVPIEVRAVGRVETYNTVTVRPRVSGQIEAVHFVDGQYVDTGGLLYTIDPRPFRAQVDLMQANLARDKAQAVEAAKKAQQYEQAYKNKAAAEVDRDTAQANAEAADATVRGDEASLENAQLQLSYTTIRSPIDGKAGDRLADIGNIVTADTTPLVVINQIKPIYVTFAVPERYLAEIHAAAAVEPPKVQAEFPSGDLRRGELTFIDNEVNPATGAVILKGTFKNEDRALWPGQYVNATLLLGIESSVVIPTAAIQSSQEGQFVYIVQPDDTVQRRTVEPGRVVGTGTVIRRGLEPGEVVVTEGQMRLRPGAKVAVRAASSQGTQPSQPATTPTSTASNQPARP